MFYRKRGDSVKRKIFCSVAVLAMAGIVFALCMVLANENARWPEESGTTIYRDSRLKVDASHLDEGYFYAGISNKTSKKLKLRVIKGDTTLTYDLNGNGDMELFPLQLGSGSYKVCLYENTQKKSYSQAGTVFFRANLSQEDVCFLYPNVFVSYDQETEAVAEADKLCAGLTDKQAFDAVCKYMLKYKYDFVKAVTVKAGAMPDIDGTYQKKMGICQDLSAVMICMLRSQGIPAKLMIGYADKNYHAWVEAIIDGKETFYDPTAALSAIAKVKTYTVERFY